MTCPYRPVTTQVVAFTGTSAASSNAFGAGINVVRLVASSACHIKFDGSPTATTSDVYLPADWPEYFVVTQGQKVAAIQASAGGNLIVTEMSR